MGHKNIKVGILLMKRTLAEFVFCNIDLPHSILSPMSTYNAYMDEILHVVFVRISFLCIMKGVDLNQIYKPPFSAFLGNINLVIHSFIIIDGAQAEKLFS